MNKILKVCLFTLGGLFVLGLFVGERPETKGPVASIPENTKPVAVVPDFTKENELAIVTTEQDGNGKTYLKVVIGTESAAFSMGTKVKEFLRVLTSNHPKIEASRVHFVVNETLIDRLGNEFKAPTMRFDMSMDDAKQINYKNITTFSILNLMKNIVFTHSAAVKDVQDFCQSEDAKYTERFCQYSALSFSMNGVQADKPK